MKKRSKVRGVCSKNMNGQLLNNFRAGIFNFQVLENHLKLCQTSHILETYHHRYFSRQLSDRKWKITVMALSYCFRRVFTRFDNFFELIFIRSCRSILDTSRLVRFPNQICVFCLFQAKFQTFEKLETFQRICVLVQ